MLFEKIRRTQKPVFIMLGVVFAISFAFLGVGSAANGVNPLDFFNSSSSSTGSIGDLTNKVHSNPKDAAAWLSLAEAYYASGNVPSSLGAYQTYLKLKPQDTTELATAASLYDQQAAQYSQLSQYYQGKLADLQNGASGPAAGASQLTTAFPTPFQTNLEAPLQQQLTVAQQQASAAANQALGLWKRAALVQPSNESYQQQVWRDAVVVQDYKTALPALQKDIQLTTDPATKKQLRGYLKEVEALAKTSSTSGSQTTTPTSP
jgi:tetratricopeptide (TPR) repeat protein